MQRFPVATAVIGKAQQALSLVGAASITHHVAMSRIFVTISLLALFAGTAPVAASGVLDYRVRSMESASEHLKAIKLIADGAPFPSHLSHHVEAIARFAATLPELFPEGSVDQWSDAKMAIWQRWPEFVRMARELEQSARSVDAGTSAAEAHEQILQRCKACHRTFRRD